MSKTAFIFPGQGSQSLGMLSEFAERPAVKQTFQEASGALDQDLWALAQEGPKEALNQTEITQPLLLTAGVALWRLWEQSGGPRPNVLAGHSLGEYSALTCAGVINLGDAVRLVRTRGQLMQKAVGQGEGSMAAILGLDDEQVRSACAQAAQGGVVEAVNFNAPGQVVIAGSVDAVVINNVDVAMETDPEKIRDALIRQLYSPVRWVETIQALKEQGVGHLYECGPGKVLSGLVKRIDRDMAARPLETEAAFTAALQGE